MKEFNMTFQYFEIMERFARGQMSEQERTDFEAQLRENKVLAVEWADYLLIARSVRNSLRSKSSGPGGQIPQLVADARELAKENGLLLTDEDIWLYLCNKAGDEKKAIIEKRRSNDPAFDAYVDRESAIIEGIRKQAAKARLIRSVRDSLHEQGFTDAVHEQIIQDMASEQPQSRPAPLQRSGKKIFFWASIIILMCTLSGAFFYLNQQDSLEKFVAKEKVQLLADLPEIKALKSLPPSGLSSAFRMVSNNLPDAALTLINNIPADKKTQEVLFLEGVALFEKNDYQNAIRPLSMIDTSAGSDLHLKSQWLLALCYRSVNNLPASDKILTDLQSRYGQLNPRPREVVLSTTLPGK